MKKFAALLLALLIFGENVNINAAEDLYISTAKELYAFAERVNGGDSMDGVRVCLTGDISLNEPFTPIGADPARPFSGSFDGAGYSLSGLEIDGGAYSGFFGCVTDGSVKNLNIKSAAVKGGDYSGILIGRLYSYSRTATVEGCSVSGSLVGGCYVGGLCGVAYAYSSGENSRLNVVASKAEVAVSGNIYVGALLGKGESRATDGSARLTVRGCQALGNVKAQGSYGAMGGGISGALSAHDGGGSASATLADCVSYAHTVVEKAAAGGIVGALGTQGGRATLTVEGCVALGNTAAGALCGGICGKAEMEKGSLAIKNCVAAGALGGDDTYPIAKGTEGESCTTAQGLADIPAWVDLPPYTKGDINGDGRINSLDAAMILRYDSGLISFGLVQKLAADTNGDGKANSLDAARVLRYDAGIIGTL